jgi:hypothetical protein
MPKKARSTPAPDSSVAIAAGPVWAGMDIAGPPAAASPTTIAAKTARFDITARSCLCRIT